LAAYSEGGVRYVNQSGKIVLDGLYFGEGPVPVLQRDPMAGPVIREATGLLLAVVKAGSK
jgi:hypothetical protein